MSTRRSRARRVSLVVAKDLVLFTVGVALIVHQGFVVPPPDFNWIPMAFGGVLAGVPGWLQIWGLRTVPLPSAEASGPSALLPSSSPSESLPAE